MTPSNSTQSFQGKVLIIGGGIGGPALALFLKKAGISSTIYEAHPRKAGVGGGFGLAPNGMNILDALGLAEQAKARGSIAPENVFYNQQGKVLARIKNGIVEKHGQTGVSMLRYALHDILTEEVKKQGIDIQFEKRLQGITSTETKVTAHFTDGTTAEGDILIGADGIHSKTRHLILPNAPEPSYVGIIGIGGVVAAADVPMMTAQEKQGFSFTYGAKGFFGYGGIENGDVMWWSNLTREKPLTEAEMANPSLEDIQKEMLAIYGDYHEPIPTMIRKSHSPLKHNVHDIQSLPTWHQGRVLLMGDAAHAVSPNAGQGASMALEDSMVLAKLLWHSQDYKQVFAQFEQDRKPRVEKVVAEGRSRGSDKIVVTPLQSTIRNFMMRIFINLFGEKGLDELYSYRIEWN